MLKDENLDHVTTHRWPPVSYEEEMVEYRKKYGNEEKVEEQNSKKKEKPKVQRKKRFGLRGLI